MSSRQRAAGSGQWTFFETPQQNAPRISPRGSNTSFTAGGLLPAASQCTQ
jgi:hypothetical protein